MNGGLTLGAAAAILLLKPLLTALFLRAGAVGGLITPALATGAAAGSLVALALNQLAGTDLQVSAVSLTCAAGVLAITQRAPLFAALFVWELARPPFWLFLVFAVGVFAAHGLRYSASARCRARSRYCGSLDPLAGVADDAHRHRAGQADVLHARARGDDRGVLQDRQHRRHVPQPRFDRGDHLAMSSVPSSAASIFG